MSGREVSCRPLSFPNADWCLPKSDEKAEFCVSEFTNCLREGRHYRGGRGSAWEALMLRALDITLVMVAFGECMGHTPIGRPDERQIKCNFRRRFLRVPPPAKHQKLSPWGNTSAVTVALS